MGKRIIVTGGSGKVGQHVITYLLSRGHDILNLDIVPLPPSVYEGHEPVHTMHVDLSDAGQVYGALTSRFHPGCPFTSEPLQLVPDAIIHLAGYPRNMIVPDSETFRINTQSAYHVIEAACKLGIKKIIVASTVCVYGPPYAEGVIDFPSFPVDEEVDANPMDTYAISKICVERTARGFARRYGRDIYAMRIAAVVGPDEYQSFFSGWAKNAEEIKAVGWSYTDARDFGQMCDLAVQVDGLGFQIFNATNDEITVQTDSASEFLKGVAPEVEFTREMGAQEAPLTNWKIRELLGFKQEHSWRDHFSYAST